MFISLKIKSNKILKCTIKTFVMNVTCVILLSNEQKKKNMAEWDTFGGSLWWCYYFNSVFPNSFAFFFSLSVCLWLTLLLLFVIRAVSSVCLVLPQQSCLPYQTFSVVTLFRFGYSFFQKCSVHVPCVMSAFK